MATLTTYRQTAAKEIGPYQDGTAKAGGTVSLLVDTAWPLASSVVSTSAFKDFYLFRPAAASAANKVRLVSAYGPSGGTLVPDLDWSVAPANGEAYELHAIIEPLTEMTALINDTLKRCLVVAEFTVTPVVNATRHSLAAAASWLTDPDWVRQVGWLGVNETRANQNPYLGRTVRGEAVIDGATVYLEHPRTSFAATDTIYVRALKPAYFHCAASAGVYGTQSGLSLESDICPVDDVWVAAGVLVEAWRRYGHILEVSSNARLIRDQAAAAAWFTLLDRQNLIVPPMTFRPLERFGPVSLWAANR